MEPPIRTETYVKVRFNRGNIFILFVSAAITLVLLAKIFGL